MAKEYTRDLFDLLDKYKNGRTVQRRESVRTRSEKSKPKQGVIFGTSLGGASKRGGNVPHLNVRVKWEDRTEEVLFSTVLEIV